MFEIWDGDLFLYAVDTEHEADEAVENGFTIVPQSQWSFRRNAVPQSRSEFLAQQLCYDRCQ